MKNLIDIMQMSTEELQDIYVTVDLVLGLVTVSVSGWEDGAVFHLIEQ